MSACPYHRFSVDYAEDHLEPACRKEYERHLAGCPSCRAEQNELGSLFALFDKEEIPYPGPEFWERVRQSMRSEPLSIARRSWRWWLRFTPALAPILAAAWLFVAHNRPASTIDFHVPLENIVQSDDLDLLPLADLVDDSLYESMTVLEPYYEPDVDDAFDELNDEQQKTLIISIMEHYGQKS